MACQQNQYTEYKETILKVEYVLTNELGFNEDCR